MKKYLNKIMSIFCVTSIAVALATGCSKPTNTQPSAGTPAASSEAPSNNNPASGKVTIRFLNGFTGGDGAFMKKITDSFNASQDKYFVEELQEKDHYLKFRADDSYDLVVMHGDLLATYKEDGLISDVSDLYQKSGISIDDFHAAGKNFAVIDEKPYAFPLDIHPLTMFYNKKLVAEAPKTYEDLVALNNSLTNPNQYAMAIPGAGLAEWYMMFLAAQNGVTLSNGEYMEFNKDDFADIMLKLNSMIFTDKISPANLGLDGEFKAFMQEVEGAESVQAAVALTGPWFYTAALEKYGQDLGVAPVPTIGKSFATYGNAHSIALSSKVTDQAKLDAAAAYLAFMFKPENLINWADAGQAPLHLGTIELVKSQADKYPLAVVNFEQFEKCVIAPPVYESREQTRYLNESVYPLTVTTEGITKAQLMPELEKATNMAKEIYEDK